MTSPQIKSMRIVHKGKPFSIEYFYRPGKAETILFVHGLGGAKENFWEACKSSALSDHTLIGFDNPGTGNSTYYDDFPLDVDDVAAITTLFVEQLKLSHFILVGASMGGLITLLYLKREGLNKVKAYINIEGNLMPEDCMFSSKVVGYDFDTFANEVFARTVVTMKEKRNPGYHIIANNLQLNTNVKSYYNYSFQTVKYSSTGELLKQYLSMNIPRLFVYGDENKNLSYLPELAKNNMNMQAVSGSNHFVFYDNPKEMYDVMADFLDTLKK
jgi:pimeloyl-ACP methyl ester carboxylesterase